MGAENHRCTHCGQSVDSDGRFCTQCGQSVQAPPRQVHPTPAGSSAQSRPLVLLLVLGGACVCLLVLASVGVWYFLSQGSGPRMKNTVRPQPPVTTSVPPTGNPPSLPASPDVTPPSAPPVPGDTRPDYVGFTIKPLVNLDLPPSRTPQTVSAGQELRVTFPASALKDGGRAVIGHVTKVQPEVCGTFKRFGLYDISLGDHHQFADEVILECHYDPSKLDPNLPPEAQIMAVSWDPQQALWVELPMEIDPQRHVIVSRTRHLSLKGFVYCTAVMLWNPIKQRNSMFIKTKHFRIIIDKNELKTNKAMLKFFAEKAYEEEYKGLWNLKHPLWIPFVRDTAYYLEKSYAAYRKLNLKPATHPVVFEIGPGWAGKDPGQYEWQMGRAYISSNKLNTSRTVLKHRLAHELFHAFQHHELLKSPDKGCAKKSLWWIESTADYAACRVAWDLNTMGSSLASIYPHLLTKPLTAHGVPAPLGGQPYNDIEYDKGYFIDRLVHGGANFATMHKAVLADYLKSDDPLAALERYLVKNSHCALPAHFRSWAAWFLLNPQAPVCQAGDRDPLKCADNPGRKPTVIPAKNPSPVRYQFSLSAPYSAKMWAVRAALPAEPGARDLQIKALKLDSWACVDLYVLPDGERSNRPQWVGSLAAKKSCSFQLRPHHTLYVVAINLDASRAANVQVEINTGVEHTHLAHKVNAVLRPVAWVGASNRVQVGLNGSFALGAGKLKVIRSVQEHGANVLDLFASVGWSDLVVATLLPDPKLAKGEQWTEDVQFQHGGESYAGQAQVTLSKPVYKLTVHSPAGWPERTLSTASLIAIVPEGDKLAGRKVSRIDRVEKQYNVRISLNYTYRVRLTRNTKVGPVFVRQDEGNARVYLIHLQVNRKP